MALKQLALAVTAWSVVVAGPVLAQTPADAPVASARTDAVDAQIAAYLNAAEAAAPVGDGQSLLPTDAPPADRKVHGEVGASIGTRGYREMHAAVVAPLGQNGQVAVAVGQVKGRGFAGPVDLGLLPPTPGELAAADPIRRSAAPACDKDNPGATPPWVERMRRADPAATAAADCQP